MSNKVECRIDSMYCMCEGEFLTNVTLKMCLHVSEVCFVFAVSFVVLLCSSTGHMHV